MTTNKRSSGPVRSRPALPRAAVILAAAILFLTACSDGAANPYGTTITTATGTIATTTGTAAYTATPTRPTTLAPPIGSTESGTAITGAAAGAGATTSITAGVATNPLPIQSAPPVNLSDPPTAARPVVALTFDDGPSIQDTPRLLDLLKTENVKATFFVLGTQVASGRSSLVKRAFSEGHEIANHTWNHKILAKSSEAVVRDELLRTSQQLAEITGHQPTLMRPPTGAFDETTKRVSKELGLAVVSWSWQSCPEDWNLRGQPDKIADHVIKNAANGHIILLHDTNSSTVDAMPKMIKGLKARGFRFMTVGELLAYQGAGEPAAGTVYYQYNVPKS